MQSAKSKIPVRDYYYAHFDELTPYNQFHFAARLRNYFQTHDFDEYFVQNRLDQDLSKTLANNDYSHVQRLEARRPYFEKYDHIFAIEAALFQLNHLYNEYQIDQRSEFLQHIPLERLYALSDALMADDGAITTLSSWAVNVICLIEIWFPRGRNAVQELAEKVLSIDAHTPDLDPLLIIYLYTHIILCDTDFYARPPQNPATDRQLLNRVATILAANYDQLTLDVKNEFLVCANLTGAQYPELKSRIADECFTNLAGHDFLVDPRRPKDKQTFNGSEHRNVLFIMSGLDAELATSAEESSSDASSMPQAKPQTLAQQIQDFQNQPRQPLKLPTVKPGLKFNIFSSLDS